LLLYLKIAERTFTVVKLIHQVRSKSFSYMLALMYGFPLIAGLSPDAVFGKSVKRSIKNTPEHTPSSAPEACSGENGGVNEWLLKERVVMISGEIQPEMAETVILHLLYLNAQAPDKEIYVYINSGGGDIRSGMAIYDVMRAIQSDVVTVSLGEASSMASILLAGGTKGKRLALPNARIMIHQPLTGRYGQASDVAIAAKEILYQRNTLNRLLADFTGQSLKRIELDTDRDFFMSAQEARSYAVEKKGEVR